MHNTIGVTYLPVGPDPTADSIVVGNPVVGGGANRVLYEDASQNLATEAAFTYNESTNTLGVDTISAGVGAVATPAYTYVGDLDTGWYWISDGQVAWATGSAARIRLTGSAFVMTSGMLFGWSSASATSTQDLILARDAAATLAQRNGTNPQESRVYDRFTSTTDYSRITVKAFTTTLASVNGATVTATGLIPAKSRLVGVNTKVTVALGTGGGTTGYQVGDGVDTDRWGNVTGTATTTATGTADATADPAGWFGSANDVVITANGGNFNGTGSIYVVAWVIQTEAD